jgi:exodeoxyribonuclease VIII
VAEQPFRIAAGAVHGEETTFIISACLTAGAAVLEMDTDNAAVQDLILATENDPEIKKYDMPALWKFTSA